MITHVKFVGIPVRDQQRALEFYTEKLGFAIATDQPMGPGQRWIELRVAHATTRVVLLNGSGFDGPLWSVRCSLANLPDEAYAKIGGQLEAVVRGYAEEWRKAKK